MKITKLICAITVAASAAIGAAAQNGTMTPYSRYGYGMLGDNATAAQRQMGGVGYAMHSGRTINVMNPASYARIDSMTFLFDMGLDITCLWSEETDDKGVAARGKTHCMPMFTFQSRTSSWRSNSVVLPPDVMA